MTFQPSSVASRLQRMFPICPTWRGSSLRGARLITRRTLRLLQPQVLSGASPDALLGMRLTLHPSIRILRSAYPVADIWAAHQTPGALTPVTHWRGQDVLIVRPDAEVQVHTSWGPAVMRSSMRCCIACACRTPQRLRLDIIQSSTRARASSICFASVPSLRSIAPTHRRFQRECHDRISARL